MARPEVTGQKTGPSAKAQAKAQRIHGPQRALSIAQFAAAYGISIDLAFKLWRDGKGPPTLKIGGRTVVPVAGLDEWEATLKANAAE